MRRVALGLAIAALAACGSKDKPAPAGKPAEGGGAAQVGAGTAADPGAGKTAQGTPAAATPDAAPAPEQLAGADFTAQAKLLFRVAACGNDDPLPPNIDAAVVERHCKKIRADEEAYRKKFFEGGRAFFDSIVPKDAPKTVVYPFGGGDLVSALVAFPDATEITTISLELAGDPRRIDQLDGKQLEHSLADLRVAMGGMLDYGSNTSDNLQLSQDNELPGQVCSFLAGLAATGFEPVGMRYFRLEDDGSVHYLEQSEIDAIEADGDAKAKRRKGSWTSPNFSEAFAHVEIRYRKAGDPNDVVRVHRHFGWNLDDDHMKSEPQLLRHLEAKGKVTMLTKGGSYLLWNDAFSLIRDYMITHHAWMLADSTGVPVRYLKKAGLVMETYGNFTDAFLPGEQGTRDAEDLAALFRSQPRRKLPFRFGYIDANKQAGLVVTHP